MSRFPRPGKRVFCFQGSAYNPPVRRLVYTLVCAAVLAALATYAWRGWYARYITDDYCTAYRLRDLGFVEAMKFHRRVWSGRYSYFPIKAGFEAIGPTTARVTPTLLMVLLGTAAAFALRRVVVSRLMVFLAAITLVYAVVDASPSRLNIGGAFLWETGALTYLLPLVLLMVWAGVVMGLMGQMRPRGKMVGTHRSHCVLSAVLMLVAGGLSETSLAAQGALTAGVLALALFFRARRAAQAAAWGLLATAPGTLVRASAHTAARPLGDAVVQTLTMAYRFLGSHVFISAAAALPLMAVGLATGAGGVRVQARAAAFAAALAVAVYIASFVPAAWLVRASAPERTLDIANFFLLLALFTGAMSAGIAMRDRLPSTVMALALLLATIVPALSVAENIRTMPEAKATAKRMDELDWTLREQRGHAAVVHAEWALRMGILGPDPDFWANQCVSHYYRLESLRVLE
jgi:hypothetical protein